MGQETSKAHTPPPLSLRDCLVDGQIDLARYRMHCRRQHDEEYEDIHQSILKRKKRNEANEAKSYPKMKRTKRSIKKHHDIKVRGSNGEIRHATFKDSTWHTLCINSPTKSNRRKKYSVEDLDYLMKHVLIW